MRPELSHHPRCPAPWDDCECAAAERDTADELERAYGEFYDPDWDYDPTARPASYAGWVRDARGSA